MQAMPTRADTVLPPTTAQGWASGLAGTPNTSTALAPSGATSQGRPAGIVSWLSSAGQQQAEAGAKHDAQALTRIDGLRRGPQRVQQGKDTVGQGSGSGHGRQAAE